MLKNKKLLYVLLPLLVIIWGLIFYRIFSSLNSSDEKYKLQTSKNIFSSKDNAVSDTFSIVNNYRDPFLGKTITADVNKSVVVQRIKPAPIESVVKQPLEWPAIIYGGMIKNQKSNKQFVLLQINGQANVMKQGDVKNGVELLVIFKDSIQVSFKKEIRIIKK